MVSRLPLVRVSGRQRQMPSGDAVPVAAGGTGAVTAAAARANLSALNALLPSLRNRLINGAMLINQRSFAGGSLASGVYGYDRWKAGSSAASLSVSSAGVITHTSGPVVQVIEAINAADLAGTSVTVSVEDPSSSLSVALAYSATDTTTVSGLIPAGAGRQSVTLAVPAGTGNLTLTLTATNTTYKRVQLESGAVATGWDARLYSDELSSCRRYARAVPVRNVIGQFYSTTAARLDYVWDAPMRAAPSVLTTKTSNNLTVDAIGNGGASFTTMTSPATTVTSMNFDYTGATSSFAVHQRAVSLDSYFLDAEL